MSKKVMGIDQLCESVCNENGITDPVLIDKLKSIVQDEVSVTIYQFIEDNTTPNTITSNEFVVSSVLENINEITSQLQVHPNVDVYVETTAEKAKLAVVTDTEGDEFLNTIKIPEKVKLPVCKIMSDSSGRLCVILESNLNVSRVIDIEYYSYCYIPTKDYNRIRDFLNDIFLRVNQLGQYSPAGSTSLSLKTDKLVPYELLYDNEKVRKYLVDEELWDDTKLTDNSIAKYLSEMLSTYDGIHKQMKIEDSLDPNLGKKLLFNAAVGFVVGRKLGQQLAKMGAKIITPQANPGYGVLPTANTRMSRGVK